MGTGHAGAVLRQLHHLLGTQGPDELGDGQLLERFTARQDEAAFAALVRRHGPMVLGVCRRLLRGGDAEDAFQATFLVLFRRARALDRRGSLAGWLYTVAYHVALRARADAARRRVRERQVLDMFRAETRTEEVWRDLQPVLDDELNRLPEKYRDPVLLCYVQGKTNGEAARLLRLPTGTVKSRLSRARELLKGRLARRGITLATGALAAVLAERASAAVPARLCQATLQTTVLLAAGQAGAAVPAVALAEGVLKAMFATRLKIATAVVLAAVTVAVGFGVGLAARPVQAQRQDEPQAQAEPPPPAAKDRSRKDDPAPAPAGEKNDIAIAGRVLDAEGKPVVGAEVAVVVWEVLRFSLWEREVIDRTDQVARTTSDAEGRFRLTVPQLQPVTRRGVRVLARAPGHGLGWATVDPDAPRTEADVRLLPEGRLAGKVIGLQGGPVAGVKIHASRLSRRNGAGWDVLPLPDDGLTATTDEQGRFTFHGVGRDLGVHLEIDDLHCAPKELDVDTGDPEKAGGLVLGVAPPKIIEGRVVYEDTGEPVPNATLEVDSYTKSEEGYTSGGGAVFGRTDARGRFKISTYPGSSGFVMATPPDGQPYLVNSRGFDWPKGVVRQEVEVKVPRGLLLHGKVTEAPSGKPLARASVEYQVPRDDVVKRKVHGGWRGRVLTAADGTYTLAVPPGPARLLVTAPTPDYIAEPVGSADVELGKPGGDPLYYHAAATLDLKEDEKPKEMSFTLRRGITLKGTLVDPDGKPVKDAVLLVGAFRPAWEKAVSPIEVHDGRWELRGCDPERTYHLLFVACPEKPQITMTAEAVGANGRLLLPILLGPKNKFGAAVDVSAQKAGGEPIEVRLQPTTSARLRFLDAKGKPVPDYNPNLELVVSPGPTFGKALDAGTLAGETVYVAAPFGQPRANPPQGEDAGTMTFEGLIPGATYRLRQFQQPEILKEFTAEAGKRVDVDVIVKRP
jgi:RNA polymerase sigma factor (sigma-70 family)